nr:RNA-directed DNA polymerase, eukaryota, reverse transcriptase zinc-binding domain protein [Tanacetum cinerariifolium]
RVWHRRIPTRLNLDCQGIDFDTVRFPVCDDDTEFEEHIFNIAKLLVTLGKQYFRGGRSRVHGSPPLMT